MKTQQRRISLFAVSFIAAAMSACSTVYVETLPDTGDKLATLITAARDSRRAVELLGWTQALPADKLVRNPADDAEFAQAICGDAANYSVLLASANALAGFNEEVHRLAKAPEESFSAYIESIQRSQEAVAAAQKPEPTEESVEAQIAKAKGECLTGVARDLRLKLPGLDSPGQNPVAVVAAAQALLTLTTKIIQIYESQERAKAVQEYVKNATPIITKALDALGKEGGGLDAAIQETRTYLVRRAFVAYTEVQQEVKSSRGPITAAGLRTADEFAQLSAQYLKVQGLKGTKLVEDPKEGLRAGYKKFLQDVQDPKGSIRAVDSLILFLKNVLEIETARVSFQNARKKAAGGGS